MEIDKKIKVVTPDGANCDYIVVTTNGKQGGNVSHGGYLEVIFNSSWGCIQFTQNIDGSKNIISARGDWEIDTMYNMAKAIVKAYEEVEK